MKTSATGFRGLVLLALFAFAGVWQAEAGATTYTWTGNSSTEWNQAGNWGGTVPTSADNGSVTASPSGNRFPIISAASGTVSVRDLTIASGATVTQTGGTLQFYHDWRNSGTFNASSGAVVFVVNAGPGVSFATATKNQFYDLTINSGVDPGFDTVAGSKILIGDDFDNQNASLAETANATFTFNGTGEQFIKNASSSAVFGNLSVLKSAGTLVLSNNAPVAGDTVIGAGTVSLGAYTLNRTAAGGTLTISNGATLKIGGTGTLPANYSTHAIGSTCTIEYNGSAQTVAALNSSQKYGNLTLSGSGNKSITATNTVLGNLEINGTAKYNLNFANTLASSAGTLTFGGVQQAAGTWGSTSSTATHKNDTYFQGTGKLNVLQGGLDHFDLSSISSPKTAGTAFVVATITAKDSNGSTVTSFTGTVDLSETGGGAGGTATPTQSGSFTLGVLSSQSVTLTKAGTLVTLTAADHAGSGATGVSGTFTVNAGAADAAQSTLTPATASITANGAATQVLTVRAKDANGNNLTAGGATVTIAKSSGPGSIGSVTDNGNGTYTATVTAPTATGSGVFVATLNGAAVKSGTGSQTQATVTYVPGAADAAQSTLTPATASITANGAATQVLTVQAKDANGNNLTAGGATVTIAKFSGTGSIGSVTDNGNGTYTATVTAPTATGSGVFVATLEGVAVGTAVGAASSSISYTVGPLDHFAVTVSASPKIIDQAFQVTSIVAQDANGNTVTSFTGTVTLAETGNGAGGIATPAESAPFTAGQLTGQSVALSKAGRNVTLTVSDSAGTGKTGTSAAFSVSSVGTAFFFY